MKDQPEDNFEQRIRERLQSLESDPPAGAWDRLIDDLPAASPFGYRRWAALLLLLGAIIGATVWWSLADQPIAQEKVALKPVVDEPIVDGPLASDGKPSAESVEPPGLTEPTEAPANGSTASSKQPKWGEKDKSDYDIAPPLRQNSAADIIKDADFATGSSSSLSNSLVVPDRLGAIELKIYPWLVPSQIALKSMGHRPGVGYYFKGPLSPDLASFALVADPKESLQQAAKNADERNLVSSVAPNRPAVVTELPKVAIIAPLSNFVSKPLPSPESTPTPSRWELWATANPMLLYQRVAPDASDAVQVTSLNRTTFSQDRLGLQASAGGLYELTPRLALKFGVYYRYTQDQWTYNYHENVTDTFSVVRVDENTVEARPVYQEQRGTVSKTSHRVGALAGLQYRLSSRWFGNVLGAELQAQSLTEKPAWYAHISYVAERKLSRQWSVHAGPSFLWNFSGPGIRGEHFVLKPYGFGVQAGVSYRLQFER